MKIINKERLLKLPDVVMFDLDNTLYDYDTAEKNAENELKKAFKERLSLEFQDFDNLYQESKYDVKNFLVNTASSHSRLLYIQSLLEKIELGSELSLILEFEQIYWTSFFENMTIFPGVVELLEELRLLEIPCCILTDLTSVIQFRKLIYLDLEKYFKNITTSEEVMNDKPNSAIFVKSIQKLIHKNQSKNIWMIGDSIDKDIIGAKKSVNAVTFLKSEKLIQTNVDSIFSNFNDLKEFISTLDSGT